MADSSRTARRPWCLAALGRRERLPSQSMSSASPVLRKIEELDPVHDYQEIARLDTCYEFPFDTTRALEFALFRTFASPTISSVLDSTQEFGRRAQRRYDDTDLILSEMLEEGLDSERGRTALRRMNRLHGAYAISNEDFLYVLSTFVFEPIRWNERFGWRRLSEKERLAGFYYWREVGRRMAIRDVPETIDELERYNIAYERAHFRYTETSRRVGEATREMFLAWFLPPFLRPLGRPFYHAVIDDVLLDAFGWPRPPGWLRSLASSGLRLRGRLVRLFGDRHQPRLRTRMRHRTYPRGYRVEDLGPAAPARDSVFLKALD